MFRPRTICCFLLALGSWADGPDLSAQCIEARVTAGAPADELGRSTAADGIYVAVGSPQDDDVGNSSGVVYVYFDNGFFWQWMAKLIPQGNAADDEFGEAVTISDPWLIAGAPGDGVNGLDSGSVSVFRRSGVQWNETQLLTPIGGSSGDAFGRSVAMTDEVCVVGAPFENAPGASDAGAVYVFRRSGVTWTEEARLEAPDFAKDDLFGWRVAISGTTIAVSSRDDDDLGVQSGSVYLFEYSQGAWVPGGKLLPQGGQTFDRFGESLALDGTTLIAGSEPMGSIHVFENVAGTWGETTTLAAYDAAPGDGYGFAVDIDGDRIAIASHLDDDAGKNSGSIYTFRRVGSAWVNEAKVVPPGYRADERYGQYIALSGDLLVGTSNFADNGLGASYFTSLADPVSCLGTSTLEVELNPGVFQEMAYVGSSALAGNAYFVLGSLSGDSPGVTTQGVHIPLNIDVYTEVSILFANFAPFIQFQGTLDANGAANPRFEVPAGGLPASAVGVTLHHALLVVSGASLVAATDAVPVILK